MLTIKIRPSSWHIQAACSESLPCSLFISTRYIYSALDKLPFLIITVNVLKFRTLIPYFFFLLKFCFLCIRLLKCLVECHTLKTLIRLLFPSGAVWSGSALFAYGILSETMVFEILGHLPSMYFFVFFLYVIHVLTLIMLNKLRCHTHF